MTPATPVQARPIQRPDTLAELLAVLTIIGAALWWMAPILLATNWPAGGEAFTPFERVEAFQHAFARGDWYPLWFPELQNGWGSADPLFHGRLFSTLAALARTILHVPLITAVKGTACFFLALGGLGMRVLLRSSGASEPWAVGGALLFLAAPFTVTGWLTRGVMADFTALMLLPWLYVEFCTFLQGDRRWLTMAVLLVLLFHADAALCGLFVASAVVFFVYSLVAARQAWAGWCGDLPRVLGGLAIVLLGIAPHLLVAMRMLRYFVRAVPRDVPYISVEVAGYAIVAAILVHLLPGGAPRWRSMWRIPLYPFLVGWSLVCLLLPLLALELPWQRDAFLSVGLIFVLISGARAAMQGGGIQPIAATGMVIWVLAMTVLPLNPNQRPLVEQGSGTIEASYTLQGMDPDRPLPERPLIAAADCGSPVHVEQELRDGALKLSADEPEVCRISIRQLHTPLLLIESKGAHVESQPPSLDIVVALDRGRSSVEVRPRTLAEMVRWSLGH